MTRPTIPEDLLSCLRRLNGLHSTPSTLAKNRDDPTYTRKRGIEMIHENLSRIDLTVDDVNNLNIVHVAGTKGKGSVCAYVESILRDNGMKTGLYTSPHLMNVTERIRIGGKPVSNEIFVKYFDQVWKKLFTSDSQNEIGYFPFLTLLSYFTFIHEGVQACIYETGVGGEYDATNVVTKPVVCGITAIGLDHTNTLGRGPLGSVLKNIAWHKGGILKQGSRGFTATQKPEVSEVLQTRAAAVKATLTAVNTNRLIPTKWSCMNTPEQVQNASLAVTLANFCRSKLSGTPILHNEVSEQTLNSLRQTQWKGRFETIDAKFGNYYLDGAHTPDSIRAVAQWYSSALAKRDPERVRILIFNQQSLLRGPQLLTDLHNILKTFGISIDYAIFTSNSVWEDGRIVEDLVNNNLNPDDLSTLSVQNIYADLWRDWNPACKIEVTSTVESAIEIAQGFGMSQGMNTLITGSFHLIGSAFHVLKGLEDIDNTLSTYRVNSVVDNSLSI